MLIIIPHNAVNILYTTVHEHLNAIKTKSILYTLYNRISSNVSHFHAMLKISREPFDRLGFHFIYLSFGNQQNKGVRTPLCRR